jgi:hypothetical protein
MRIAACFVLLLSLAQAAYAAPLISYRESGWKYKLGTAEASNPVEAWRAVGFDDSSWSTGAAPIGYPTSPPDSPLEGSIQTTLPTSTVGGYTCVFLRKTFVISNLADFIQLNLTAQHDDGFAAWINGTEIGRSANVPAGALSFGTVAGDHEVTVGESAASLNNLSGIVVLGTNVLAVQVFNSGAGSSDLFLDASLTGIPDDPPTLLAVDPPQSATVLELKFIDIIFTENVTGVDASDLLINGTASVTNIQAVSPREYVFQFAQPPTGVVSITWAANPGIMDVDGNPNAFAPAGGWTYTLDPNAVPSLAFISEFMADNSNGIRDEDGERRDWIELYNPGPIDINLGGWYLTDQAANLTKWRFPSINLAANKYMIVWASEKNKTNPVAPLHTNFRLGKDAGGYLALVTPGLSVASQFTYPAQTADISYGRDRVDPNLVGYYTNSTPGTPVNGIYPGAQNSTSGSGFAADPQLSLESGVYTNDSLTLTITAPAGVTVRYTFDGTEPTSASAIYAAPITFTTNMIIKVRGFSSSLGVWPSRVLSRSFVMLDNSTRNFTSNLPIFIISTQGRVVDQQTGVVFQRTKGTFVSIDTFRGRSSLQATPEYVGLSAYEFVGQTSFGFEKKPIRIELNDALGNDLSSSILGLPADADWNLRNPYNDKSLLNDFLGYELWDQMGHYSCRRRFVEVFFDTQGGKLSYPADYYGIMVLFEHIEQGNDRVDIAKLSPAITNEPGISGGYIIKKDKDSPGDLSWTTTGGGTPAHSGQTLKFHEPKPREITPLQISYISNYVRRFEQAMYAANWTNAVGTNHYSYYADVDAFVDQQLHVELTKQIDGYRLSSYYAKDRNGKLRPEPVWDWNLAFGNADYLQGGKTNGWYWNNEAEGMNSSTHIWLRRMVYGLPTISSTAPYTSANGPGDPDFRQKMTDRWSDLRNNILNGDRLLGRIDELVALLRESSVRNYAKYPALLNTHQWPNPEGPPTMDVKYTQPTWDAIISEMKRWTRGRYIWMDNQFLPAPGFDRSEGNIAAGAAIVMAASQGAIYYTTDGSDPRLSGGGISPSAKLYTAPVVVNENVRLVARAYVNPTPLWTPWSGPVASTFVVQTPRLVITEIMYHPAPAPLGSIYTTEDFEYIEVKNVGTTPLNLNNYTLSGGIEFTFPNVQLAAGERAVVVKNQAAFAARYGAGIIVAGQYTGSLANEGNRLILQGRLREPILDFSYDDKWYPITDGFGFSLVVVNENAPATSWGDQLSWRPSGVLHGTPGAGDTVSPSFPRVVISEALTHSDPPPPTDTIELSNLGSTDANVGGWYLTDDFRTPKKFRIPAGRVIPANGQITFNEGDFNDTNNLVGNIAFALSSTGDELYLFSADAAGELTGYVHGFDFEAQRNGVTFGRYVTASGAEHFVAQSSPTLGAANAGPQIGPVVISEIMYRPQDTLANGAYWNDTENEYIELHNTGGNPVLLADAARPTNTWKLDKAVEFQFASGTSIDAGGYLLVVNFDPVAQPAQAAAFRAKYGIGQNVALAGPYKGNLDNDEGTVALYQPDTPNTNGVIPYVLVERVHYHDSFPWPTDADGLGQSLQRLNDSAFGDDFANWVAGGPTPGAGFSTGAGPTVITQPTSAVVQDSGTASATFTCTAIGGTVRYQWLYNGSALAGATSGTLSLQNIKPSQAGEYRCVVLNAFGSAVSAPATLTVLVLPKISQHPGSQKINPGANVSMAVIATSFNPPLRYQWFRDGYIIPGATNSFYNLANVQDTEEGSYYAVLSDGNGTVTSGTAELKVLLPPTLIQPVPAMRVTAVAGETVTMGVQTRGTKPMLYRWRRVLSTGAALIVTNRTLNANSDFLVLPNVQTNLNNAYFLIILTNELYTAQNLAFTNAYLTVLDDSNSNGIPDVWESTYFGSSTGADRDADSDGDGMSNYAEYVAGTDPTNPASYLKADITAAGLATIQFPAVSNRTYTVEYRDGLNAGPWTRLADVVSRSVNWNASVVDRGATTNRFYRLATPKK